MAFVPVLLATSRAPLARGQLESYPALTVQGRQCPVYPHLADGGGGNRTDFPDHVASLCFNGNRVAPALQVLGCMKCGTSSLHYEVG